MGLPKALSFAMIFWAEKYVRTCKLEIYFARPKLNGIECMIKLLMSWDIRQGKESEYFEYVVQEFAPKLMRLGVQPTEAWYTVYGNGPQILTGGVVEDRATLDKILASEEWGRLKKKLFTYVTNFTYKIVQHTGNFQM
ncbi:MAG: hypothetical protein B6D41_19555 [Chloroflexi bacterium UTCFX4]|jgi:hypothetical protein|nr:MAG: hypothetical protein B6D41_19555 [Chloroflexi bacterium UTCFX4]